MNDDNLQPKATVDTSVPPYVGPAVLSWPDELVDEVSDLIDATSPDQVLVAAMSGDSADELQLDWSDGSRSTAYLDDSGAAFVGIAVLDAVLEVVSGPASPGVEPREDDCDIWPDRSGVIHVIQRGGTEAHLADFGSSRWATVSLGGGFAAWNPTGTASAMQFCALHRRYYDGSLESLLGPSVELAVKAAVTDAFVAEAVQDAAWRRRRSANRDEQAIVASLHHLAMLNWLRESSPYKKDRTDTAIVVSQRAWQAWFEIERAMLVAQTADVWETGASLAEFMRHAIPVQHLRDYTQAWLYLTHDDSHRYGLPDPREHFPAVADMRDYDLDRGLESLLQEQDQDAVEPALVFRQPTPPKWKVLAIPELMPWLLPNTLSGDLPVGDVVPADGDGWVAELFLPAQSESKQPRMVLIVEDQKRQHVQVLEAQSIREEAGWSVRVDLSSARDIPARESDPRIADFVLSWRDADYPVNDATWPTPEQLAGSQSLTITPRQGRVYSLVQLLETPGRDLGS